MSAAIRQLLNAIGVVSRSDGNVNRVLGYKPDRLATRYAQPRAALKAGYTPPTAASLANYRGPTLNQNSTGSCTGHGTAQAVYVSHGAAGLVLPFFPSPRILYATVREIELPSSGSPLTDSGAMPSDLITVVNQWGVAPIGFDASCPTPDGYYTDVYSGNVNTKTNFMDLEESGLALQVAPTRLDETSSLFGTLIQQAIAPPAGTARQAIGVGIFVDTAFMNWDGVSPITSIDTNDPNGGGHWLDLDYFYTSPTLGLVVGGINSWSSSWGKSGQWEMTIGCLQSVCSDALAFGVGLSSK